MGNEYPSDYSGWHQAEPSGIPMNDLDPFEIEMLRAAAQRQHQQKGSERIDLNAVMNSEYSQEWVPDLIAELKRCYEQENELLRLQGWLDAYVYYDEETGAQSTMTLDEMWYGMSQGKDQAVIKASE